MLKNKITSLELLKQINQYRKQEGNRTKLRHDTLLQIIRDEFSEEFSLQNILERNYKSRGKEYPMYVLTLSQGKQVLVRESKYVRRRTIQYLEKLEEKLIQIAINKQNSQWQELRKEEKLVRRRETDKIQELIVYAKKQGSKHSEKLYTVYSRLIHRLLGIETKEREALAFVDTIDVLRLEELFFKTITKGMEENKPYKDIYRDCCQVGMKYVELMKGA